jgi:hypothetical protein
MKIMLHAGVKCTDEERLLTTLRSNKDILAQRRVAVPDPRNYRVILRETLSKMHHQDPSEEARDILLDVFLEGEAEDIKNGFPVQCIFLWHPERGHCKRSILSQSCDQPSKVSTFVSGG